MRARLLAMMSPVVLALGLGCSLPARAHPGHPEDFCPDEDDIRAALKTPQSWEWKLPRHFPRPVVPADNPMSQAKVALGRLLFYDQRLSANQTTACGSCHQQARAFTDGRARSVGATGQQTPRSAQHLANSAWHPTLTWANPALTTLERQMLVPLYGSDPVEMGVTDDNRGQILARIARVADYQRRFRAAFPGETEPIRWNNIVKAIASFERSLISGDSRFDRYQRGEARLSPAELRGKDLFFGEKAECFHCHGSFNFNDQVVHQNTRELETPFHNTGLYNVDGEGAYPASSQGSIEVTGRPEDMGRYRAPSLRNIAVTAPFMHDGSIPTLRAVVATYAAGGRHLPEGPHAGDGRRNPYKSELIGNIDLSPREQADLVAFLHTLTDRRFLSNPQFSDPFRRPRR